MKKISLLILINLSLVFTKLYSQSGWYELNSGTNIWLEEMQFVNENTGYIGSDGGFILKTTNAGLNWQSIQVTNSSQHYIICLKFFNANTGILSGALDYLYITNDGGNSFNTISNNIDAMGMSFPSRDTGYINTKYQGVFKTTNGGLNWFNVLIGQYIEGQSCFTSNDSGYISRCEGGVLTGTILKTVNGGINWQQLIPDSSNCLLDVKFINSMTGFCCGRANFYGGVIYKTTNQGTNWQISGTSHDCDFYNMNFPSANVGYAVSWYNCDKILKTTNAGASWTVYSDPMFNHLTSVYFINENTGFAASSDGRIIKTTNGGTPIGIQPISSEIPEKFILYQNYPNPFNPSTKIKFDVPGNITAGYSVSIKLIIYDILGKKTAILVNELLNQGSYETEWDAANFPSGIYYYKLEAVNNSDEVLFTETKKLVLIK